MQYSVYQTATYVSCVVNEEVETLVHLIIVLLLLQRPRTGSQGTHCRVSPARQEQVWNVLGGDAGKENSISETR